MLSVLHQLPDMLEHVKESAALRQQIVKMKTDGIFLSAVSSALGRSKSVIQRMLKVYNKTKTFVSHTQNKKVSQLRKTIFRKQRVIQRGAMNDSFKKTAEISR